MNGTHQVLAYADDVNLLGNDIRTIKRNGHVFLNACKDIALATNTRKTKYLEVDIIETWQQMSISRYIEIHMKK